MKYTKHFLFLAISLLFVTQMCSAATLSAPVWRGEAGTTWQGWEFDNCGSYDSEFGGYLYDGPDYGNNPYGTPLLGVKPGSSFEYMEVLGCMTGVWPLSGSIKILIPNSEENNPLKIMRVQMIWSPEAAGEEPLVTEELVDPGLQAVLISMIELETDCPDYTWYLSTYELKLRPNPKEEVIRIAGGIYVDAVVVDTWCTSVPEPGSAALVIGALALIKRRKK